MRALGSDELAALLLSPGGAEHMYPCLWLLGDAAVPVAGLGGLSVLLLTLGALGA